MLLKCFQVEIMEEITKIPLFKSSRLVKDGKLCCGKRGKNSESMAPLKQKIGFHISNWFIDYNSQNSIDYRL